MYDLSSISEGTCVRAPRIILLGVEKIGKSTFASSADNPIFLPIKGEEGIDDLNVAKTPICNSPMDVLGWLKAIRYQDNDWKTVVLDSISALDPITNADICEREGVKTINDVGGGFGKGYAQAMEIWRNILEWLDFLRATRNMASILIGHVKVQRFNDPSGEPYDRYTLDANDKVASLLYRWSDCILFCNTKVVVRVSDAGFGKTKNQGVEANPGARFLYTQKRPAHPGGGRGVYGELPYELPLGWKSFMYAVSDAMVKRNQ